MIPASVLRLSSVASLFLGRLWLLVLPVVTTGCHCVQGPTARGVGIGPVGFGDTAETAVIVGLRAFVPEIGIHGEVAEKDDRHGAVVFDLSVPGRLTASRMVPTQRLEQAWPLTTEWGDPRRTTDEFLLFRDRALLLSHPVHLGGFDGAPGVLRVGETYVIAGDTLLIGPSAQTELTLFPKPAVAPGVAPTLAASPDGRTVAGVFALFGYFAPFRVSLAPTPRVVRAPEWIQVQREALRLVLTAVADDGTQLVRLRGATTNLLVSFAPDGTPTTLPRPPDDISQLLAVPGGWLLLTNDAVVHLDTAGVELGRTTPAADLSDDHRRLPGGSRHMLLLDDGRLVLTELDQIELRRAEEGFCGEGRPALRAVRLCATWLTARLDPIARACQTLDRKAVLSLALPEFPLGSL
jgi:hypothetical protein